MKKKPESYAGYFRPHLGKILLALALTAISTASSFGSTHVLSTFVGHLSAKAFDTLGILIVVWLTCELASKITTFGASKVLVKVHAKVQHEIKWQIAGRLANASVKSVEKNSPVSLSESASEDVNRFMDSLHSIYQEAFAVVLSIATLVYTAILSWQICVMFIISFFVILIAHFLMMKKLISSQTTARTATVSTKYLIVQIIQAFADIKVQGLTQGIKPHLTEAMEKEVRKNLEFNKVYINNSLISDILSLVSQALFLILSGILISRSQLSVANFVALYMYRHYIYGLTGTILRIMKSSSQLSTAKRRMDSIFHYMAVSKEKWGHTHLTNPSGNVSIKNISVTYGQNNVLDNLSVDLPSDKFIGIVGKSGCGKSTLLQVLTKQTSYSGEILLDGIELSELSESSIRKAIALTPQQPFLFDFTIKENLLLGNPEAADEEIWIALRKCAADKFVHEKGGLDTVLTPKELSGGQKQRLALTRMALRGGKIILMDESTSALDGESQEIVIKTMREAANNGHTMVLVAHRVSSLKSADIILLMDKGKIIEKGTYEELFHSSEKFRMLAEQG